MSWRSWVKELLSIFVLTFSHYSSFEITANLEPMSWFVLVALTPKLALLAILFEGGSSNGCWSLLTKGSVEDWLRFWNWKRSCQQTYQNSVSNWTNWCCNGKTKLGPLDLHLDLQESESSILVRLMAFWSGPFNVAVEIVTVLPSNQSFFLFLSCLF